MHNRYRTVLKLNFAYLIECEATDVDPVASISKQKTIHKIRITLTPEERSKVDKHLKLNYPSFHRFTNIFFHSGGRLTELMQVKASDVDLVNQTYKAVIKKGNQSIEKLRTIKNIAIPFWEELIKISKEDDFLFGKGLVPGQKPISTAQITRRWETHVKEKLKIKADFYSLKHSNLDEISASLNAHAAAAQAGHTSTAMIVDHYAVGEKKRQHELLKGVGNSFAG